MTKSTTYPVHHSDAITHRTDIHCLVAVFDGNIQGDPDRGNSPRQDNETGHGLGTDAGTKRKIRDYIGRSYAGQPGYEIWVRRGAVLGNALHEAAASVGFTMVAAAPETDADDAEPIAAAGDDGDGGDGKSKGKKGKKAKAEKQRCTVEQGQAATRSMCQKYWDARAFGGVMSIGPGADNVHGPVQVSMSRSIDPIHVQTLAMARVAVATQDQSDNQGGRTQGFGIEKHIVPFALYQCFISVSTYRAQQTGFSQKDLDVLIEALQWMWLEEHSSTRGVVAPVRIYVHDHDSVRGNAQPYQLQNLVQIVRTTEGPARKLDDYTITYNVKGQPEGVKTREVITGSLTDSTSVKTHVNGHTASPVAS